MKKMQDTIQISTRQVEAIVTESGAQSGLVNVYPQGATAEIMILFNMIYPLFAI